MGRPIDLEGALGGEEGEEAEDFEEEFEFGEEDLDADLDWTDPSAEQGGVLLRLFEAAAAGDADEVAELAPACRLWLADGVRGPDGDTALHVAALYGHADCFAALLEAGAQPCAKDSANSTVLHDASAGGSLAVVQRLLELVPELVGSVDDDEETPLHCAARGGHSAVVSALLAAGAPRAALNVEGQTARDLVDDGDTETAQLLS